MGCTPSLTLGGISYSCDDIAVGGLKRVLYTLSADATLTETSGEITAATIASGDTVELEFNNKDGFSAFSEEKTVEANGVVNVVPTVVVEFPKMTASKRAELDQISVAGIELIVWVETAAGTYHAIGVDFGAYCSLVSGQSGTGRSEKNMYQVTFTGEEDHLSYSVDSTAWTSVVGSLA